MKFLRVALYVIAAVLLICDTALISWNAGWDIGYKAGYITRDFECNHELSQISGPSCQPKK